MGLKYFHEKMTQFFSKDALRKLASQSNSNKWLAENIVRFAREIKITTASSSGWNIYNSDIKNTALDIYQDIVNLLAENSITLKEVTKEWMLDTLNENHVFRNRIKDIGKRIPILIESIVDRYEAMNTLIHIKTNEYHRKNRKKSSKLQQSADEAIKLIKNAPIEQIEAFQKAMDNGLEDFANRKTVS